MWEQGRWEDAIKSYFKLDRWISEEMAEGKKYHEEWAEETRKTNCLPLVFGGTKLIKPIVEEKKVVEIFDWLDLVGIIDCYDEGTIYEYKTGISNSQEYARTSQVPVYGVLSLLSDMKVKKAEIHHYNQYEKQSDMFMIWMTDAVIKHGFDWIETHASDMHNYFVKNNLYALNETK